MNAAARWGEQHFGRSDFVCLIAPENAPSLRLAEKLGYREYGRAPYRGEPSVQLRRA
jgi:RimJ/RimL family protein N-acetyltransferase